MANSTSPTPGVGRFGSHIARCKVVAWLQIVFTLCAITAFTAQNYVLQVHIHHFAIGSMPSALGLYVGSQEPTGRDDESDCPLCQAFAMAGLFFAPTTPSLLLALVQVSVFQWLADTPFHIKAAQFSWNSRAPPGRR